MLSLYVHVPFCVKKCHYCGFYSTPYDERTADLYLDALEREIGLHLSLLRERHPETVYIGGGTPTAFNERQARRLFRLIGDSVSVSDIAEFTVEVNPGTSSDRMLALARDGGANRVSIGVQSFDDEVLRRLGRIHTAEQTAGCIAAARKAGFANISVDLMFGVPGMTGLQWRRTLERAVDPGIEHVSAYSLSVDEGSRLAEDIDAGRSEAPPADRAADQYDTAVDLLERSGFRQYEISNFAKPGHACRHNGNYWDRGEYIGLGPAAWSFLAGRRYGNIRDLHGYRDMLSSGRDAVVDEEVPTRDQAASETIMLGLRKTEGLDLERFEQESGAHSRDVLLGRVRNLDREDLVRVLSGRLVLTMRGMALSNEVIARLIG